MSAAFRLKLDEKYDSPRSRYDFSKRKKLLLATLIVICLAFTTGHMIWSRSPVDLGRGDNMSKSGLYAQWAAGGVVVLVRHAERCDRSSHPCMGPLDGITTQGSEVSRRVGDSFKALGLERTDILTSPSTRTTQTAFSMFGHAVQAQDWLYNCESFLLDQVVAHKASNRNLVLVTHSGCMAHLESQQGFKHAEMAEYDSALFLTLDARGKPKIQGFMNANDWKQLAVGSKN
ncbi:lipopolysaccharide core heptose(II)-phosphate phosphatase PmrG [Pseudomonas huanghezhanensis]|uniref:lipopolysaccharide core heptose(II)-phosphate phosphatase PmrG n=1 Tax=Pseudomonas huanghezhanensis TaxID=3002903 RepID=UPI002285FCAC|nr:histidine phosphatase family protein [Pseudomonas sp. BSw22131]